MVTFEVVVIDFAVPSNLVSFHRLSLTIQPAKESF